MILNAERRQALTAKANHFASQLDKAVPYLIGRGLSKEAAEMFGFGYVPEDEEHGGRLAIPYWTPAGVVSIKYRCMQHDDCKANDCIKYKNETGLSLRLFNAQALLRAGELAAITEGELDAVSVQAYCGIPTVAYPGVDSWQKMKHWRLCFEGIQEVVVIADGDKVGREAAQRVAESIGLAARVVDLPDGQDANKFIQEQGAPAFLERVHA